MPQPSWDADKQRASLSGFARLRAVLWPRSLRLMEWLQLGRHRWYRRLRRKLWLSFRGMDLHSKERLDDEACIYGATPTITLVKLLELAKSLLPEHPRVFLDLGSGTGELCLAASALGYRAVGMEREPLWVDAGNRIAAELNLPCEFVAGDFLQQEWPDSALVFVVATAFSEQMRSEIFTRFRALGEGSLLLAGDWELGDETTKIWEGDLPVEWGVITFRLYRR